MNNLTKDLQDIVFSCAGGISDMGKEEINAIIEAVLRVLPDAPDGQPFRFFVQNPDQGWTEEQLSQRTWGYNAAIHNMRERLLEAKESE